MTAPFCSYVVCLGFIFSDFRNTTSIRPVLNPTIASQSAVLTPSSFTPHEPDLPFIKLTS
mgnify:CR=1 FL=1